MLAPGLLALVGAWALAPEAQRPSEAEIFGPPAGAEEEPAPPAATPEPPPEVPEDPLRFGGQFYLRAHATALEEQGPADWSVSSPSLLDLYGDARPNPRVRAYVLGRLFFDPTLPPGEDGDPSAALGGPEPSGATTGTAPLTSLLARRTRGPTAVLDQLWLRFDVRRTMFVTAGKQHVRWGTARFWTPTDFLHLRRRNPLDVFDARTGTTMLKLHLPWEARAWNFYAYGLVEGEEATPALGDVAGAARAEIVLGTTELGAGAVVRRGRKPRLAADLSTGLGPFDLYGEVALRYGSEIDRVRFDPAAMPPPGARLPEIVDAIFPTHRSPGLRPQAVGGFTWSRQYADKDVLTVGGEYFYNALGYDDPAVYPGLVLPHARPLAEPPSFFYLGRHYAALFLFLPSPWSLDLHSFTFSTLGNLSDGSYISRLDHALTLLTHLRLETFVAVRYGAAEGELRFGLREREFAGVVVARPPAWLDVGVALRVSL